MTDSHCRIKSVKFKSGGFIEVLPDFKSRAVTIGVPGGEVVFRAYDDEPLTVGGIVCMAKQAQDIVLYDDD